MDSKTTYSFNLTKSVNARVAVRVAEILFVFSCNSSEPPDSIVAEKVNLNSSSDASVHSSVRQGPQDHDDSKESAGSQADVYEKDSERDEADP